MIELYLGDIQSQDHQSRESYKMIRSNIQFCGDDKKVINVTSSIPSEGKTNVSFNVAYSLAESGQSVLYIDADLRRSVFQKRTRIHTRVKGLSYFLTGQAEVNEVIQDSNIKNLALIVAGPKPPNPAELLESERFARLIGAVRQVFDYVIIDTPPLGSVIDSAVIAKNCDGIIYVVASKQIKYKFAQQIKKQIDITACPILGVILNKVNISDMHDRSYYGNYY